MNRAGNHDPYAALRNLCQRTVFSIAMNRLALAAFLAVIPTVALCQPAASSVPPPGTIEGPKAQIKVEADGPPRSLIRIDLPDTGKPVVVASGQDKGLSR